MPNIKNTSTKVRNCPNLEFLLNYIPVSMSNKKHHSIILHLFLLAFTSFPLFSFGQVDFWQPIDTTGFGSPQNYDIVEFETFNGNIYCATGRSGSGTAQIRYSSTGNSGTWTQVTSFSPPLHPSVKGFPSFGKLDSAGIMWTATGSGIGTRIYRTTDGLNFTAISKIGFNNNSGLITPSPNMVVFQGSGDTIPYLYAGGGSHGGTTNAEVWRIPYNSIDSLDWVQLIDFDTVETTSQDTVDLISYWYVWNNKIYFTTNGKGQLWESTDGVNFTQNMLAPYGKYGFGVSSQIVLACMQVFNDTMYVTTTNKFLGGQMYRTGDGLTWNEVTLNAFGKADTVEELHNMDIGFGYLWVTSYTDTSISQGNPIWRSSDGLNFVQSNSDGFGNPLNNGENSVTIQFGNNMYFGGPNYTNGSQLWRTEVTTGMQESTKINSSIKIYPNPFVTLAVIKTDNPLHNATLTLYNLYGQIIKQINNLSGQEFTLHRDNLLNGLYFIHLTQDGKMIMTEKLVVTD